MPIKLNAPGAAPVGLILIRQDSEIVVANSNRFTGGQSSETIILIDVKRALSGRSALLGSLTVGSFPREMALDGQTLLLTNYNSNALSLIDISKLPTGDRINDQMRSHLQVVER